MLEWYDVPNRKIYDKSLTPSNWVYFRKDQKDQTPDGCTLKEGPYDRDPKSTDRFKYYFWNPGENGNALDLYLRCIFSVSHVHRPCISPVSRLQVGQGR